MTVFIANNSPLAISLSDTSSARALSLTRLVLTQDRSDRSPKPTLGGSSRLVCFLCVPRAFLLFPLILDVLLEVVDVLLVVPDVLPKVLELISDAVFRYSSDFFANYSS